MKALICVAFFGCPLLFAQASPAAAGSGELTVSGSIRTRIELWDWFPGAANNDYAFSGTLARLSLRQSRERMDWQLEFAAPLLLGLPDDAIAPGTQGQLGLGANYYGANHARNAAMVFAKQGWIRIKGIGWGDRHSVRLGRFEFVDGGETVPKDATLAWLKRERISQRLLGIFNFSHVGRSFDGVQYAYDGRTNVTVVGARPTRGVYQVDGWGEVDAAFGYAAVTRPFSARKSAGEWRLFFLQYEDWRNVVKTDNRPLAARRAATGRIDISTLGGNYLRVTPTRFGPVDLLVWGAVQAGNWGALVQRSGALSLEAGYQPSWLPGKLWFRGGYDYESGDGNPSDGTHGTFFQVLPTPRIYARTPFYNLLNLRDGFGQVIARPHSRITLRGDVHSLALSSGRDLWYQGGGAYQPWTFGYNGRPANGHTGLATFFDLSAEWQATGQLTATGYVGAARGGAVVESIYPQGTNLRFGYLEMLYRF